ncbi:MAG: iron ABC transporter permease [Planctomycetota bacterium]
MKLRHSALAMVLAVPVFLYILYPLGAMLSESVTHPVLDFRATQMGWDPQHQPFGAGLRRALYEEKTREAIWGTLKLSLLSALTSGAWGLGLALLWTRREFPGRRYFAALGFSPMLMPPLVGTLAFDALMGESGMMWRFCPGAKSALTPFLRVLLVHTYSFGCYTFAYVAAALEDADTSREEAARSLGAGWVRTFFAATWPTVRAPLLAAALVTFMASAASFSAPYMLDNASRYLTVEILNEQRDPGLQRGLSVLLAAMSLGALPLFLYASKRSGSEVGSKGDARRGLQVARRVEARVRLGVSALVAVPLILPPLMAIAGIWSRGGSGADATLLVSVFRDFGSDDWISLARSMGFGAVTAVMCMSLAAAIAVALRKSSRWAALPIEGGVMLALALPGSAVAVALLSAFNAPSWPAFGIALGGGNMIMILAYVVRTLPLAVRPVRAAYDALGNDYFYAAGSLGARASRVFFRVTLPLIFPSLLAGGVLCFIAAAGEYVASALLYSPSTQPVSVRIYEVWREDAPKAHALALCLMVVSALAAVVSRMVNSRRWDSRSGGKE